MKGRILLLLLTASLATTAQKNIKSQLTNANVYYGFGAELSHTAKAQLQNGTQEITIENLSTAVDVNTIQIAVPENVVLLSYRFNTKETTTNEINPALKRMEDSIKLLNKQFAAENNNGLVTEDLLNKTSRLIETYSSSQNKTITTAELIKLLDFYTGKVQVYRTTLYVIQLKKESITEELEDVSRRLEEARENNSGNLTKVAGEMILQLMAQQVITADIGISYFTQLAGWIPTYDMRVRSLDNSFKLAYKASVNQRTGLDWKQVKLTLSTSNPNQGNTIPTLNPLYLQMYNPVVYNQMRKSAEAKYANNRAQSMSNMQITDQAAGAGYSGEEEKDDISDFLTLNESQLNTSYEIDLPYDIPSDGKTYSVAIKEENIKASYKHYAIPKLDKDAFLLAEVSNWENLDLLPGEANIIMDNVYLGKSFVDPNTTMDTLNLSLGRDKRIAVKRTLVKEFSKSKVKGDTKTETFTFQLTVKNNKKQDVAMLLKDQLPISNMKEVIVNLDEGGGAEVNEELGTLNWKISLKPGESKIYRFSYSVIYPKDKKLTNLR
jgi:uncharacterized protein (TIGR02231 family)